jgi:hypothetical protein
LFVEPSGKGMAKLPEDSYKTVFQADPGWIKGAGVTVEPDGTAPGFDKFVLQGVDWRKLLTSEEIQAPAALLPWRQDEAPV